MNGGAKYKKLKKKKKEKQKVNLIVFLFRDWERVWIDLTFLKEGLKKQTLGFVIIDAHTLQRKMSLHLLRRLKWERPTLIKLKINENKEKEWKLVSN